MDDKHTTATLDQWMALCLVVEKGGVHAAARHLGRSHSAISHAVLRLQQLVGAQLLEVQGRRSVPTKAGSIVVRHAKRLLSSAHELEALCTNLNQGWEPELRVAVDVLVNNERIRKILNRFAPQSRGTRVRLERHTMSGAAAAAHNDDFDLVFTASLPPGTTPQPVLTVSMVIVVHRSHPIAREGQAGPDPSQDLQLVIGDTADAAIEQGWLRSEKRWTIPDFEVARSLLLQGNCFCIVPRDMFLDELEQGEFVEVAPQRAVSMQVHLVTPKGDSLGPCGIILRDCARSELLAR